MLKEGQMDGWKELVGCRDSSLGPQDQQGGGGPRVGGAESDLFLREEQQPELLPPHVLLTSKPPFSLAWEAVRLA